MVRFYIVKLVIMRLDITEMAIYNQDTVTKLVKKRVIFSFSIVFGQA